MTILKIIPLCDAIVQLMDPLVEVVIHDLDTDSISYIKGQLSKRVVGNPSLLDSDAFEKDLDKIVYPKLNFDGRLIKSISIPFSKKHLICINCDISIFSELQKVSAKFLQGTQNSQPESLFKNDWQDKLHLTVNNFIREHNLSFDNINSAQKKSLIKQLFESGAFNEKNAADYVAKVLKMGRATVFNYLKEWR